MTHHATNWLLQNARVALGPDEAVPLDITVHNGRIRSLLPPGKDPESTDTDTIDLEGCLILPGLINAHVTLLEELRAAAEVGGLAPARLYSMVTETAARVLRLGDGEGCVREGGVADLIALRDCGESPCETLIRATTQDLRLLMTGGHVKLLSPSVARGLSTERFGQLHLHPFSVEGLGKFLVAAKVEALTRTTEGALGPDSVIRLAGRQVFD